MDSREALNECARVQADRFTRNGAVQYAQLDRLRDDQQLSQEKLKDAKSLMETKVISHSLF
ncbi:hypothetical protein [Bartonella sp. B1098]|uniref:hypothetical protein n=1 Tax=Bartonella sp. B1098 TaxID=2911421 RepID=UPI0020C35DE4|nr:hypothetical protein [Bartonella sp. B1098]